MEQNIIQGISCDGEMNTEDDLENIELKKYNAKKKNDLICDMIKFIYMCQLCGRQFALEKSLIRHQSNKCEICRKCFNTESHLEIHIESVHENIEMYKCDTCEKSFEKQKQLLSHLEIHSKWARNF